MAVTICCKNQENKFELEGTWRDVSCENGVDNCESNFPIIVIDSSIQDSIEVRTRQGFSKKLWSHKNYQTSTITLEDNYESLLFPIYNNNTLAYFDNTKDRFVYYKKTKSDPR